MDIYSHATGTMQREATERMDNAFRGIQDDAGGNSVAKALPSPKGKVVTI